MTGNSQQRVALAPDIDQPAVASPPVDHPDSAAIEAEDDLKQSIPIGFQVATAEQANWLVRRVLEAREYKSKVAEWAESERRRAEREEQSLLFLFGQQLQAWASSELAKFKGRRKTLNLPAGMLSFRHENEKLVIDDEQAVLEWARGHLPDAIQTTEKLMKSILNQHFADTREVPETGAHVAPATEKFSVR